MVKRLLFLTVALIFFQLSEAYAQISIGTVDPGPYTPGSSIAATFSLGTTCITPGNTFELYLSDANGSFTNETRIGTYTGFYSTFVNGTIPPLTTVPSGNYMLRVKSTNPAFTSGPSTAFSIVAGPSVSAALNSESRVSTNPLTFGRCDTDPGQTSSSFFFENTSSAANVTVTIINELDGGTPSTMTFNSIGEAKPFTAALAHYTMIVKATANGTVATTSYFLVNNLAVTAFTTISGNTVCFPIGSFEYLVTTDRNGGIRDNFPGNIYNINWGDGSSNQYTYCDIVNLNKRISHIYTQSSCGLTYNSGTQTTYNAFGINVSVMSPFCGQIGSPLSAAARVVERPQNSFTYPQIACIGDVTFRNTSTPGRQPNSNSSGCTDNTVRYTWNVDGVDVAINVPFSDYTHTFTTTGPHTIKLTSVSNGSCQATEFVREICIQNRPQPSFTLPANTICLNPGVLIPTNTSNSNNTCQGATFTYTWNVTGPAAISYQGGTNAASTTPQFKFTIPGIYNISLTLQSASCGETTATQRVVVNAPPTITMSPDISLCNIGNLTFGPNATETQTTVDGTIGDEPTGTYEWIVTGGDYTFASPYDKNSKYPVINFTEYKEYTVTLTHTNSCGPVSQTQKITFVRAPVPTISVPSTTICYDGTVQLTGNITNDAGTTFTWSSTKTGTFSPTNDLTTTFTPSNVNPLGEDITIQLLVNTGLSGNCAQVSATQIIKILPRNTGSTLSMSICSENNVTYTPTSSVSGSTFTWTAALTSGNATFRPSGSGVIDETIVNTSTTTSALVTYTITPRSNNCDGIPYQLTVTVNPLPILSATAATTICSGQPSGITLSVTNTPGPTTYTWTSSSTNGVTGMSSNPTSPAAITAIDETLVNNGTTRGTVTYNITPYAATGCPGTPVTVVINVDPALTRPNAGADRDICATNVYTLEGNTSTVGTGTWTLTSANGPVTFTNEHLATTEVSGLVEGRIYTFRWTIFDAASTCISVYDEVTIAVNEPTIPGTTAGDPTIVCANNNTGTITLSGNTGNVIGWESSFDGTTWTLISGTNIGTTYTFNNLSAATHFRAIVQNGGCTIERSSPTIISVAPATTPADAGMSRILCNEQSVTLTANSPATGEAGLWTMVSGNVNAQIATPANPQTTVAPLVPGVTYVFRWTITGNAPCGPTFSDVTIRNNDPIGDNTISTNTVVCSGQQVLVDGSVPTGGDGTYTYTWEMQENNGAWIVISNATGEDLTTTLTNTLTTSTIVHFRRNVSSGECTSTSNKFPVTVQPPIANNTVAADQPICSGSAPAVLTGSMPTGGDGQFLYQWQSSQDGTIWTNIPGALAQNYQPPILTQTTFYRRTVGTLACSGSFQSASDRVRITVNPNAQAEFTWGTSDTGCAPYALPIVTVPYPDRNATYTWSVNDVVIPSTGSTFPGYTITTSNQSVTIKLLVTSSLGCAPAEFEHGFSTNQAVPATFTPTSTTGCGPLQVNFVNESIQTAGARFRWNFGNGQSSSDANPQPITFQSDASGKDTTYIVTLYAITDCGIDSAKGTVLVKSGPKPIFSPSTTSGCSPLSVDFTNNSPLQTGIEYFFNFGDGTPVVRTTDRSTVSHIYRTTTNTQTFNATLSAINQCGQVTSLPYAIVVRPNTVNAELVVNGTELRGCAPFRVTFDNNSTGATDFIVDFKDGTQPRQSIIFPERFVHTFTAPGTYEVTLTATNGCSTDVTTETIVVLPQPLTEFEADNTLGCPGLTVKFKNNTQNGVSYRWDFGDGSPISNEFEPTHTYTGDQEYYTVTLTATNNLGCTMAVTKNQYIHIVQPPVAAFNVNPSTLINIPDYTFRFEDESTNTPTIWEWDFGDGTGSALKNPSHTYLDTGTYKVTLKVLNQQGCFTSTFKNVTIKGVPGYLFVPNSFVPGNTQPELREFRAKGSGMATWRFSIFNKWGQLLWETTKLEEGRPVEGWDGTFKGQQLPQGVYYWKVDVQMVNGSEWKGMTYDSSAPKRTGAIHLIR